MKVAVRYYTKTGNTKKLADAVAAALGVEAESVETPLNEKVDLLFLGSSVYAAGVDSAIKEFINNLDPSMVGAVVNVSTAALLPSTYNQVRKLLEARGIAVKQEEFHCRGQFHALHKGKPDEADVAAAASFAKKIAGAE
ncbi:MAG: flavodoxin [Lachnospiraceae bacterium]|nr:flavodoxin [Lachnospiraceae bacterium]